MAKWNKQATWRKETSLNMIIKRYIRWVAKMVEQLEEVEDVKLKIALTEQINQSIDKILLMQGKPVMIKKEIKENKIEDEVWEEEIDLEDVIE